MCLSAIWFGLNVSGKFKDVDYYKSRSNAYNHELNFQKPKIDIP